MEEKRILYANRGCREFGTCSESGEMTFFNARTGQKLSQSEICQGFPAKVDLD
jgi:hypothetical protein